MTTTFLPRAKAASPSTWHWLASSMRITSKSMVPSSKLSSAAASGMIQTGTAWWHSRSVLRASSLNFPTSLPVPLPIFRCSPSHPFKACCCFNPVLSSCAPGEFLDIQGIDLLALLADEGNSVLELLDIQPAEAQQLLGQLAMRPCLLEIPGRLGCIMRGLAKSDRLRPARRDFGQLLQQLLSLFECRLQLEHLPKPLPGLVVRIVVNRLERLLQGLQERCRGLRGLDRANRFEPLSAFSLQVLQFQVFELFACKRNQLIADELNDPRCFGLLLPLER